MIEQKSVYTCIQEWYQVNSGDLRCVDKETLQFFLSKDKVRYYTCSDIDYTSNYYNKIKEIIAVFKIIYLIR